MKIEYFTKEQLKSMSKNELVRMYLKVTDLVNKSYADYEEVVHCKDCKHWNEHYRECNSPNWDTGTDDCFVVPAGFYCGWAERRGE